MLNPDFRDMLSTLSAEGAEFLLTSIDDVEFEEAWPRRKDVEIEGQRFAILGWDDLLRNKKASPRPKDHADAIWLETGPRRE